MVIFEREIWKDDGHKKRRENATRKPETTIMETCPKSFTIKQSREMKQMPSGRRGEDV